MFLVEGNKNIAEVLNSAYKITDLFSINPAAFNIGEATRVSEKELKKISFLQHPKDSVALCKILAPTEVEANINIILDGIQDPGNLGTIIRLADWFGIEQIVCSEDTVDLYNPKVIQASMGSFTRVNVVYKNILEFIENSRNPTFGADMDGESIYKFTFPEKFNLVLGNEGNGVRAITEKLLMKKITIPRFGKNRMTESLNVSMAAGIILGEIFSSK